jgi:hypothetical protein
MNYLRKDQTKFSKCTHFLGIGSERSSSYKYQNTDLLGLNLNRDLTTLDSNSVLGISVEGNRTNRVKISMKILKPITDTKCIIILDNEYNRNRSYNIGEREVASLLRSLGYDEEQGDEGTYRTVWFSNN